MSASCLNIVSNLPKYWQHLVCILSVSCLHFANILPASCTNIVSILSASLKLSIVLKTIDYLQNAHLIRNWSIYFHIFFLTLSETFQYTFKNFIIILSVFLKYFVKLWRLFCARFCQYIQLSAPCLYIVSILLTFCQHIASIVPKYCQQIAWILSASCL